jgi:hypothetical protein
LWSAQDTGREGELEFHREGASVAVHSSKRHSDAKLVKIWQSFLF